MGLGQIPARFRFGLRKVIQVIDTTSVHNTAPGFSIFFFFFHSQVYNLLFSFLCTVTFIIG